MIENLNIAYIGGGSRGWAWGLMSDLANAEDISGDVALSCTIPEEARNPDGVHFYTPQATEVFTNQVLSHLLPALGITEKLEYREEMYTDKPVGI